MLRPLTAALVAAALAAAPALAEDDDDGEDIRTLAAAGSVDEAFARLETAVAGAGFTVFAAIDHAAGAASVDMELAPNRVLVFGNPKGGTPAMQADPRAGLYLPLRIQVYEGPDGTLIAWEPVSETLDDLDVAPGWMDTVDGALEKLATAAAGG